MIGALLSIILAILLWFSPYTNEITSSEGVVRTIMVTTALIFLIFYPVAMMLAWMPLQKAEQNVTPRILEMFRKDGQMAFAHGWLIVFPLATFILVIDPIFSRMNAHNWFFPLWIVLLGIAIDAISSFVRRVLNYLNPFGVIRMFAKQAKRSIQNDRELDLCDWIDALSEVAIKGIQRSSTSVTHLALDEQQELARLFLEASKSIAHEGQDKQMKSVGVVDKVSFTMFYLYQRLDIIFDKALKNRLEPTCTLIVTTLGKISVAAAKYDMSLASAPLRFLGKCAKRAQDEGFEETALTASCVFFEVAKEILTGIDITYYEIKDAFLSIINGMEVLAKGAFKHDKSMNIPLLIQPFKDLRGLFQEGKAAEHQDTPIIVQNIDRVIGEFEALFLVMNTMPPIPKIEEAPEAKA